MRNLIHLIFEEKKKSLYSSYRPCSPSSSSQSMLRILSIVALNFFSKHLMNHWKWNLYVVMPSQAEFALGMNIKTKTKLSVKITMIWSINNIVEVETNRTNRIEADWRTQMKINWTENFKFYIDVAFLLWLLMEIQQTNKMNI